MDGNVGTKGLFGRTLITVVGKGGVGKTTVVAVLAKHLSSLGQSVLVIDVEGKHDLARLFGHDRLSSRPVTLADAASSVDGSAEILGCTVAPETALIDYLADHNLGLLAKRLGSSGVIDVVATSTPGIKDLLVLGRIKSYVHGLIADVVIIDTPASGHAVTFLLGPHALAQTASEGTIRRQANEARDMLAAPNSGVLLVTLAEEMPVNETLETAIAIEQRVGATIFGVVVNAVVPSVPQALADDLEYLNDTDRHALVATLTFERSRVLRQSEQIRNLASKLAQPQIILQRVTTEAIGTADISVLADMFRRQARSIERSRHMPGSNEAAADRAAK